MKPRKKASQASAAKANFFRRFKDVRLPDVIIGSVLAAVAGIMPLILRFHESTVPQETVEVFGETYIDILAYWKGWFLIVSAIVIAVYTFTDWLTKGNLAEIKKHLKNPVVIFSLAFLALTLISTLLSDYTHTSLWGARERREGAIVWLSYFTVFIAAMFFVRDLKYTKYILAGLTFSSIIMGIFGVSQLFNRDLVNSALVQFLITAGTPGISAHPIFDIAYGTLYNPNTFGKYSAMIAPTLLITAFTYKGSKIFRALILLGGILMFLSIFASGSFGGMVGASAAIGVLAVTFVGGLIYRKRANIKILPSRRAVAMLAAAVLALIIGSGLLIIGNDTINRYARALLAELDRALDADHNVLPNYRFQGNTMYVLSGDTVIASMRILDLHEEDWMVMQDGEGNPVPYQSRTTGVGSDGFPTANYSFAMPGYGYVSVNRVSQQVFTYSPHFLPPMVFAIQQDRIFGIVPGNHLIDMSEEIPTIGFLGREAWGSSRGFIWSRTFPLMPGTFLIGTGPDTFTTAFPSHDMVGKLRFMFDPYLVIDKAHNIFLQTWVTTGGLSAIILFGLFVYYMLSTFLSLVKYSGESLFSYGLRLGILAGVSAFVVAGMGTDSTIGSTGVFFVLLGMGFGLNAIVKKTSDNQRVHS